MKEKGVVEQTVVSLNGRIEQPGAASVAISSPAVAFGLSVFETLRGYRQTAAGSEGIALFRVGDHLKRLARSAEMMRFPPLPSESQMSRWLVEAAQALGGNEDCHLRITALLSGERGRLLDDSPVAIAIVAARRPEPDLGSRVRRCHLSPWVRISRQVMPPLIKCAPNYHNSRLALLTARESGFDSAVMLNAAGNVAEGPVANLFLIREGRLVTPDLESDILDGITRDSLLSIAARDLNLACEERPIDVATLLTADEAFFSSTGAGIEPISSLDGKPLSAGAPGPVTRLLADRYGDVCRGAVQDWGCWLMSVNSPGT